MLSPHQFQRKTRSPAPSESAGPAGITPEEKQKELVALLRSGVVRENTGLYSLLSYLGRKSLDNGVEPLKEYTIGVEALGKPADYDPRVDPTVRVDIGKLRAKLAEYYEKQGAASPIRVDIPRGHYHLVFSPATRKGPSRIRRVLAALGPAGGAVALAGLGLGFLTGRASRVPSASGELSAELRAFWGPFVGSRAPVLISYGTPLFLKLDRSYYRDPHVNDPRDAEGLDSVGRLLKEMKPAERRWVVNFTGLGEAEAVFQITRLLAAHRATLQVQRSTNLSWEDMKGKHVILLGSHKFNSQISELPLEAKYQVASHPPRVVNLQPAPGEPPEYRTLAAGRYGEILEEYALISMYPGFTQGTRLLVLACSSSEGTGAAAEYVTRSDTVKELLGKMGLGPGRALPEAFQVVVKAQMKGGIPLRLSHVSHHVSR
jgi:hypothetical protein